MNEDIPMMKETPQNSRRETLLRYGCAVVTVAADRKSTRLNSSHSQISYAVFCLKKKKKKTPVRYTPAAESALPLSEKRLALDAIAALGASAVDVDPCPVTSLYVSTQSSHMAVT